MDSVASVGSQRFATCSEWEQRLNSGEGLAKPLEDIYGLEEVVAERREFLSQALALFGEQFPENLEDEAVVFRAPGRINLRGMHIDKHGGACNAVAVDREIVAVAVAVDEPLATAVTFSSTFVKAEEAEDRGGAADGERLQEIVNMGRDSVWLETEDAASACAGWRKYLIGAVRALAEDVKAVENKKLARGVRMVLLSNIPQGAGVSSSHALIITFLAALQVANKLEIPDIRLLEIAKEVERHCGTTTGLSDQGAIILSKRNRVLHGNFYEGDIAAIPSTIKYAAFPENLRLIVVDSTVVRSLAGDAAAGYAVPRFAYSLALCLLQKVAKQVLGDSAPAFDRIAHISPSVLIDHGGAATALKLVSKLPQRVTVAGLLEAHPDLETPITAAEDTYFSGLSTPVGEIPLRGPLVFGITECERARTFFAGLRDIEHKAELGTEGLQPLYSLLGMLMSIGHQGDHHAGSMDITDEQLEQWMTQLQAGTMNLAMIPGSFRASTKGLDAIQETMLAAGAYGASLTGGGMGGCVVGLFPAEGIDDTLVRLKEELMESYYSKLDTALKHIDTLVFVAHSVDGASFL